MMDTYLQIAGDSCRTGRFPVPSHAYDLHAVGMLASYLLCFVLFLNIVRLHVP